jgi:hypothetical protein
MICQTFQTAFQQKNDSILKGGIQVNEVFGFVGDNLHQTNQVLRTPVLDL